MINFDHNATTPIHATVREALRKGLLEQGPGQWGPVGNPSSVHALGRSAREIVELGRRQVAHAVGATPLEVTLTSGGTEADNLALLGVAEALRRSGKPSGVLTSRLEHPAVLGSVQALAERGHPTAWVECDAKGRIDLDALLALLGDRADVGLVSLSAANHELGNRYPIGEWVAALRGVREDLLIHTDAVQAFGKVEVDFAAWDVDLLSISSHKIYGPPGVGALVHRQHLKLAPQSFGGHHERGRRLGTENWLGVLGFGVAAELVVSEREDREHSSRALQARLHEGLLGLGARVHGDPLAGVGNTLNVGFEGAPGELVCMNLDLEGFAVSTGSACSAGSLEPSPVLLALGLDPRVAGEAIRISLGASTRQTDIEALITTLAGILKRVREVGSAEEFMHDHDDDHDDDHDHELGQMREDRS